MKKLIIIISITIICLHSYAQTELGKFLIGAESDLSISALTSKTKYDGQKVGDSTSRSGINLSLGFALHL